VLCIYVYRGFESHLFRQKAKPRSISMTLLFITNSIEIEAKKVARHLLEKRIIGCANVYPIQSMYRWESKIVEGVENVPIEKTTEKKV
jgi:uncharacterized protein involved in tolerance to divalent cations